MEACNNGKDTINTTFPIKFYKMTIQRTQVNTGSVRFRFGDIYIQPNFFLTYKCCAVLLKVSVVTGIGNDGLRGGGGVGRSLGPHNI